MRCFFHVSGELMNRRLSGNGSGWSHKFVQPISGRSENVKWFEAFKLKWRPQHERDAPQAERVSDDTPQVEAKLLTCEPFERLALLSPRERDLFLLLLEGYTLKESANQLSVKYSTANTHMTGIYKKLSVNSRAELIIRYRDAVKRSE